MKKITVITVLALLCVYHNSPAQSPPTPRPLTVGDTLPDIVLQNILYHPAARAPLSRFKAPLVLLDFWSSWCGACIRLFPHMDSLQRRFGDSLSILLVNTRSRVSGDDAPKITGILEGLQKRTGISVSLPVVYDTPELDAYFPHQYLPHEVWLDSNRVVVAITGAEEVTEANIQAFLQQKDTSLHYKFDLQDFDTQTPLYVNANGGNGDFFKSRAVFTGYIEGLRNRTGLVHTDSTSRVYLFNQPLRSLLYRAYPLEMKLPANRQLLDIRQPGLLSKEGEGLSYYDRLFCYDLVVPRTSSEQLKHFIREDIRRAFTIQVLPTRKKMECWIVRKGKGIDKSFTRGGTAGWDLDETSQHKFLRNQPVASAIHVLNNFFSIPLIDKTGMTASIDMDLPANLKDEEALLQCLRQAGFRLKKVKRVVPVTLITDK